MEYHRSILFSCRKTPKSAFTLIELLAVVSIVLVLMGVTFGITKGVANSQARAKARAELAIIAQALEAFKLTYGDYPLISLDGNPADGTANARKLTLALSGLSVYENQAGDMVLEDVDTGGPRKSFIDPTRLNFSRDFGNPASASDLDGVYLVDPWRQPYVYVYGPDSPSWESFGYALFSTGPDRDAEFDDSDPDTAGLQMNGSLSSNESNLDNIFSN